MDNKARAELEGKLLAALDGEAAEMGKAGWDQMRERAPDGNRRVSRRVVVRPLAKSDLDEQALYIALPT